MARADDDTLPVGRVGPTRELEAEYTLEFSMRCPHCGAALETLMVVRLLRTRVNFTSTLPRRGRVLACPHCHNVLSAELAGFA